MQPDATALSAALRAAGIEPSITEDAFLGIVCRLEVSDVRKALEALASDDGGFAMLVDLHGTDTGEAIELTYHIRSFTRDEDVFVKTVVPYDAKIESVWTVYPAALYPEREVAEMLGLRLSGHPNPKRLLTNDQFDAPILRRSVPIRTHAEVARPGIVREPEEEGSDA